MGWVLDAIQRRRMGVTTTNIRRILVEMKESGELEGKAVSILAVEVLNRLVDEKPDAFKDPSIDWDKLLEFIEKLLPLILKIIEMFT